MRHIFEYLSKKDVQTIVSPRNLKKSPFELGNKMYDVVKDLVDNQVKDIILQEFKTWFKDNPNRRNIKCDTFIDIKLRLNKPSDAFLKDVISEMERIGVTGMGNEFGPDGERVGSTGIKFSVGTAKQFNDGDYKYDYSIGNCNISFQSSRYGNGYNNLPIDDMNVIRQKLYDCINDSSYEIISIPTYHRSNEPDIPRFEVILQAEYDKRKLKEFLSWMKNDHRLQNFADRMESTSKGIQSYYTSKRSGDYTGD